MPHADALVNFANAAIRRDADAMPAARAAVLDALGAEGLVDAAGVVGNFERMNRIANAGGLQLDAPAAVLTADIQEKLGLETLSTVAHQKKRAGFFSKAIAKTVIPIAAKLVGRKKG